MTEELETKGVAKIIRVLLVEDREDDAELILRRLSGHQLRVESLRVSSAEEMRKALAREYWDLIISDYFMPGFTAVDALEVYQGCGLDIPFIVVSGSIGEEVAVRAMKAGAHDYLMKDNLARLGVAVERELREASMRRERRRQESERHDLMNARQLAEDALLESERRFRMMADNIPNLAWMAHADGHLFWYNRRWYEYTGTTVEQMEGWGWRDVHDPLYLAPVTERWKAALLSGQVFEMEFPLRGSDGVYRWFLTQVRPVRNESGEVVRWFGTNTNIDDKKKAEEALRQSEELARSVVEGSPDGVHVLDLAGRTILINEQARRSLLNRDVKPGTPWMDSWGVENRKRAVQALSSVLKKCPTQFEGSYRNGLGNPQWVNVSVTPLIGSKGTVTRVLCIERDITAARRAEEEVRQTAKLESLGVMAGGIAHDFNNLLTGILGNASLLSSSVPPGERPFADDIILAAERAADLTKQLLAYSGRGTFHISHVNLTGLMREMLRLVAPSIEKNIELSLDLQEGCYVEGDGGQLQQVIMNLVINAGEAMEGRAGVVAVKIGRRTINEEYLAKEFPTWQAAPGEYVALTVKDNGKGMDEETKLRIFDPFFTTKFTGRGLGLAAVSGIVRGHSGMLHVSSVLGQGTTFEVLFPFSTAAVETAASAPVSLTAGKGTVLVVDDEEVVRRVTKTVLARNGYEVLLACNGHEALAIFEARHREIDVVFLDMMMPLMSGEEILQGLDNINEGVPVILCSGYNESEVARRFAAKSVGEFLQKPYTKDRLLKAVQKALSMGKKGQSEMRAGST